MKRAALICAALALTTPATAGEFIANPEGAYDDAEAVSLAALYAAEDARDALCGPSPVSIDAPSMQAEMRMMTLEPVRMGAGSSGGIPGRGGYSHSHPWHGPPPIIRVPPGGETPAIPEPATWLMLIAGFGAIGALLRRRKIAAHPANPITSIEKEGSLNA